MKTKKYIVALVLALLCVMAVKPVEVQATTFEDVKAYVVDDMTNYDQVVGLSWKLDWSLNADAGVTEQTRYGKFTIPVKSYVRIKMATVDEAAFAADDYFRLYANETMATPLTDNHMDYGSGDDWFLLEAGTYYVECGTKKYMKSVSNHCTKIMIGAVPEEGAVKATKTISADGKSVTVTVEQKLSNEITYLKWKEGKHTNTLTMSVTGTTIDATTSSFTVTENGSYTILFTPQSGAFNKEVNCLLYVDVNEIGANLEKGKTYKSGNLKYMVVTPGLNGTGTVMVTGVVKKKASITIPKTVTLKGHSYKIVKINKNTFKGQSKIKKIIIKSTDITSIGKNAIKGINKKATIKVPKSKLKDYKKLFKSNTGYKKTMKIKK